MEEVNLLLDATTAFYTDALGGEYPNLESFEGVLVDFSFDASSNFPVEVDFDGMVTFGVGSRPSESDLVEVMEGLDYNGKYRKSA